MIYSGSSREQKLNYWSFSKKCNEINEHIKFSYKYSRNSIIFLDVMIYKNSETRMLETTLYVKPTDSKSYLDFSSCHPFHNKSSIPFSQFLRIKRNCSEWSEYAKHALMLCNQLSSRGYPYHIIMNGMSTVNKLMRVNILEEKSDKPLDENTIVMVINHNPSNPDMLSIIKTYGL